MPIKDSELALAIVGRTTEGDLGIVTMHFSFGDSQMSGAWDFKDSEMEEWSNVLSGKCLFFADSSIEKLISKKIPYETFDLAAFISDAIKETNRSVSSFNEFVSADKQERSKLVHPNFFDWEKIRTAKNPKDVEFQLGTNYLQRKPQNEISELIGIARILKLLMDSWRRDELERLSRKTIYPDAVQKIRPRVEKG